MEQIQKLSVLHCVYQMIVSADGGIDEERDADAVELALTELGLSSGYAWSSALQLNPHDCFFHLSSLSDSEKQSVRDLITRIANMGGNNLFRSNCANYIFELCKM